MESAIKEENSNPFWSAFHVSVILSLIFPSSCFSSFLFFSFSRPLSCWNDAAKLPIYISKCEERNFVMSSPSPPLAVEETLCETNWNGHLRVWGKLFGGCRNFFFLQHNYYSFFYWNQTFQRMETYVFLDSIKSFCQL